MPVIMKENVQYAYTDKGIKAHTLSYAEYQALSTEEKMNGDLYFIPDKQPEGNPSLIWDKLGTATLDTDADNVSDAVNELNSSLALKIKSNSADITTNSSGSGVITNSGTVFIIQVHLNSIGNNSYTYRLGQSGNVTYLHLMNEQGNPIPNKTVNITWLYIDFAN